MENIQMENIIAMHKHMGQTLQHLAMVAEQASEGIAVVDLNGTLRFANTAWATIHGYETKHELLGKQINMFHTTEQIEADVIPFIKETIHRGELMGPVGHVRQDGTPFATETKMTMLKGEQGKSIGVVVFATDITEHTQAQERLAEQAAELKAENEELQQQIAERSEAAEQLKRDAELIQQRLERQTAELTAVNGQLQEQTAERSRTEDELNQYRQQSEQRIEQQTAELTAANEQLRHQMAGHQQTRDELINHGKQLEQQVTEYKQAQERFTEQTSELTAANEQLQQQITERMQAEDQLREQNKQLQQHAEQQTAELEALTKQIEEEVTERTRAKEELKQYHDQLEEQVRELTEQFTPVSELPEDGDETIEHKLTEEALLQSITQPEVLKEGAVPFNTEDLRVLSDLAKRLS